MNPIAEEMLMHYGMPKRSGRYPWGSGDNPYQHSGDFLSRVDELRKQGITFTDEKGKTYSGDTAIAKSMGLTTSQFRTQLSLAKDERRALDVATAKGLREKGYSLNEIAKEMGFNNDSSVRSLLNVNSEIRMNEAKVTADFLKKQIDEKGMLDVGAGVERELGVSKEKLQQALYMLEMEGYPTYGGGVAQITNAGKQTNLKVLCPPGTEHKEIFKAFDTGEVHSVKNYDKILTEDGTKERPAFVYPESMSSKRLKICYAEEGGINKDGVIEIRRGVEDLSLGNSKYAQVRILVDGDRYLKGMALYADDLPDGVDVRFNTNKKQGTPMRDVLKTVKDDPDNPFGALIKEHGGQSYYIDKNGKEKLSLINKTREEGDWGEWVDKMPSQVLAKQNLSLIKKQLNLSMADKQAEFDEICSYNNPTVKKALLQSFANDCDAAAEHLKVAALPRQKWQVMLPVTDMKETEVYAPQYKNGEKVALVRTPHAGTFEIPILTVNNKQPSAKKMLGNALDAIGIHPKVAERLSGADFDGDFAMVIPTHDKAGKVKITSTPPLKGLEGFDPKMAYGTIKKDDGYYNANGQKIKVMSRTNLEMGKISNLITDMTIKGANDDELARAVRHSMVVIDAEKHKLDYKASEQENGIASLKKKYQGRVEEDGTYKQGAATIFSRSKNEQQVLKRKGSPHINEKGKDWYDPDRPEGALVYKSVKEEYYDAKTGKMKLRTQKSSQMLETDDAYTLVSDARHPKEMAYADYANKMKSLANQARKEIISTGDIKYNASAKKVYDTEVRSLNDKLRISELNAPRERQAQVMANAAVKAKIQSNPGMTKKEIKKIGTQELTRARATVGAKRTQIDITDKEWEAIQSGAVSPNTLTKVLKYADMDNVKQRAMPRATTSLSTAKINKIKAMNNSNYSISDIAQALGVSPSTVSKYL